MVTRVLCAGRLLLRACSDVVFPPFCLSCGILLEGSALLPCCRSCRAAFVPVDDWDLPYRAALLALTAPGGASAFVTGWYFEQEGPVRALVHRLKYGGAASLGAWLGARLGERVQEAGYSRADVVLPLPLHRSKERERGYNQSALIARAVSRVIGSGYSDALLRRTRFTESQTTLSSEERSENVRNAFEVPQRKRSELQGRTILLVDDVVTTGATMRAAALALRSSGARSVVACSVSLAR